MKWLALAVILSGCINGANINLKANPDGSFEVGAGITVEPTFEEKWTP